jgi:Zn-dependent protease with chaperone function
LFAPRGREPDAVVLAPEDDAQFTAAVQALSRAIGIRAPREIRLSHQANAWVQFSPGLAGLVGGHKTLTIGLPLVAGMNARQLVGVLAHEFGHFAQRGGMRAAELIHGVNRWLESRAYHPDAWDDRLRRWSEDEDNGGLAQLTCAFTLACLWLTRLLMRGLFHVSFRMSQRLSQEMEFDADRYEAIVSGSDGFATTALRLRALARSLHEVDHLNRKIWREGKLVGDLPAAVGLRLAHWTDEDWRTVSLQLDADDETRFWDSHPADQARIASAQALAAAGLFRDERPATALFADFPKLSRRVTEHFYRDMALEFDPRNLVDGAQLLGIGRLPDALAQSWDRYTNGMIGKVPLLDPSDGSRLPASAFAWQACVDELRRLGPEASGLWQRLERRREKAAGLSLWVALIDLQVDFVMPDGTLPDGARLREDHAACQADDTPDYKLALRILAVFARRLRHAVAALDPAARIDAQARLDLLQQLHAAWPRLQRMFDEGRVCLRLHGGMRADDQELRHHANRLGDRYREQVGRFLADMDGVPVPQGPSLGQQLRQRCGRLSSAGGDNFQFIHVTSPLEDAFLHVYQVTLAELVEIADAVEKQHGIRPIRLLAVRPQSQPAIA